jgi:hypothetical protein
VDRSTSPWPTEISRLAFLVQERCKFALGPTIFDEHPVDAPYRLNLVAGAGHKDHAIRLEALLRANWEFTLRLPVLAFVNEIWPPCDTEIWPPCG